MTSNPLLSAGPSAEPPAGRNTAHAVPAPSRLSRFDALRNPDGGRGRRSRRRACRYFDAVWEAGRGRSRHRLATLAGMHWSGLVIGQGLDRVQMCAADRSDSILDSRDIELVEVG